MTFTCVCFFLIPVEIPSLSLIETARSNWRKSRPAHCRTHLSSLYPLPNIPCCLLTGFTMLSFFLSPLPLLMRISFPITPSSPPPLTCFTHCCVHVCLTYDGRATRLPFTDNVLLPLSFFRFPLRFPPLLMPTFTMYCSVPVLLGASKCACVCV